MRDLRASYKDRASGQTPAVKPQINDNDTPMRDDFPDPRSPRSP